MVWLLSGLVLSLGLAALVVLAVALLGRVRRSQGAVTALRITFQDGSSRLRAGRQIMRDWRVARHSTGATDPGA